MEDNLKGSRILLVEDEETLGIGLEYNLSDESYTVEWAKDGRRALELFGARKFDLIILDVMLPYLNGFEIAQKIRESNPQLPILIITARTSGEDRVKGLEAGADDYLTKPFLLKEFLLRVRGMLKRSMWYKSSVESKRVVSFGGNEADFGNLSAKSGSRSFMLTQREAMLLKYLHEHQGEVVSRKELLENVWQVSSEIETRTVDIFISRLRKYFEKNPDSPQFIRSVRGAGYMFVNEDITGK